MPATDKPTFTLDFEKPLRALEDQLGQLRESSKTTNVDLSNEIEAMEAKIEETKNEVYTNLSPWQKVQLSRHPKRPYALDYINSIFADFQELCGDRLFRDDRAIIGGTAFFEDEPVMIIAQQKGRDTKENITRNFGYPNPEGYRKALRLMKMAERFGLPIFCFIDTPGAYPGIGSEERHVAEAIAVNLREMSNLKVPIIATVIGEGGSGGALGIGVADIVLILQNAYYSVIAPESCATILWKDRSRAPEAAENLRITADQLLNLGVVDEIIEEPFGGAHLDPVSMARNLARDLSRHLKQLLRLSERELLDRRYEAFRKHGDFEEAADQLLEKALAEAGREKTPSDAKAPAKLKAKDETPATTRG